MIYANHQLTALCCYYLLAQAKRKRHSVTAEAVNDGYPGSTSTIKFGCAVGHFGVDAVP
jgi:hypothetical protein